MRKKRMSLWLERQVYLHSGVWAILGGVVFLDIVYQHELSSLANQFGITKGKIYLAGAVFILCGALLLILYHKWFGFFEKK